MPRIEVLKAARQLISNPANWCTHALAMTPSGDTVDVLYEKATRFCALGALYKTVGVHNHHLDAVQEEAMALEHQVDSIYAVVEGFPHGLVTVNNCRGHQAVLDLFDKTIARLEAAADSGPTIQAKEENARA